MVNLLRQERRRNVQQLADEAFADLLKKNDHPVDVKEQLRASLGEAAPKEKRRERKTDAGGG
jgi:hypothetical protein